MSPELTYLVLTALLTLLLWIPYITALIVQMGLGPALMDTEHEFRLEQAWARRAQRAHANAVENLVVFAALIAAVELANANTALTATLAMVFFLSRLAHAVIYIAGIPVARTLVFAVGVVCQVLIALSLLGVLGGGATTAG